MAIKKKAEDLKKKAGRSIEDEDEDAEEEEEEEAPKKKSGKSAAAAPAEDEEEEEAEEPAPKTKVKVKAKEEAKANEELTELVKEYDENVAAAEQSFIALVEYIQDNQVDRATVIATLMQARGLTFESAQTQYSKMKKIFNNEEVLQDLKDGKITLKVAREKTKSTQKNPKAAKPEAKEQKYNNTLKHFVAAAKESGFARSEIMLGVEAELKSAGIK